MLGDVAHVPGFQLGDAELGAGIGGGVLDLALGQRTRTGRQVRQEGQGLVRRLRHLGLDRTRGGVGEAEQLRGLVTQRQNLFDPRRIVMLRIGGLVGGASGIGARDAGTQLAIVRLGQDRLNAGLAQRDQPALQFLFGGIGGQDRLGIVGQPGKHRLVGDMLAPGFGRIEHGIAEFGGQAIELDPDRAEAGLGLLIQRHA